MTEQEKKINKIDLKSYKDGDSTIHSMIPGINNIQSVGSSPLIRKGFNSTISTPLRETDNMLRKSPLSSQKMGGTLNLSLISNRGINRNASSNAIMQN